MDEYLLRAFLAIIAVSINASVAGTLTVFRKASFLVAGASHAALAGAALAVLLGSFGLEYDYFLIALVFAVVSAVLASYAARFRDINTGIAISFALSMSLVALFLSVTREYAAKAWELFFGDLLLLTENDIYIITLSTAVVVLVFVYFYYRFLFIFFDPEGAEAFGLNVKVLDYILVSIISLSVVSALKAVGAILVFAIFVVPAAAAKEVAKSVHSVFYMSFLLSFTCLGIGILLSLTVPVPTGAFAAFLTSLIYFIILIVSRLRVD